MLDKEQEFIDGLIFASESGRDGVIIGDKSRDYPHPYRKFAYTVIKLTYGLPNKDDTVDFQRLEEHFQERLHLLERGGVIWWGYPEKIRCSYEKIHLFDPKSEFIETYEPRPINAFIVKAKIFIEQPVGQMKKKVARCQKSLK